MARLTKAQMVARSPVALALNTRQMPDKMWRELSMAAHISLEEAIRGVAQVEHRDALASVVNTMLVLTSQHCTPESVEAAREARDAILRADMRKQEGKSWALDGVGIQAVRAVICGQDMLTKTLGVGDVVDGILGADALAAAQIKAGLIPANSHRPG